MTTFMSANDRMDNATYMYFKTDVSVSALLKVKYIRLQLL